MSFKIDRILYATDLGPRGPDVFRCALSLAERYSAELHILHVIEEPSIIRNNIAERYISASVMEEYRETSFKESVDKITKDLKQFSRSAIEASESEAVRVVEVHVMTGRPARSILTEADRIDADCIVLGSHRYSGVNDMIIGSVARKITLRSKRPVFLFPI